MLNHPRILYIIRNKTTGEHAHSLGVVPDRNIYDILNMFVDKADYDQVAEALEGKHGTGLSISQNSYRYSQIDKAVDQMGGFANFSVWVNEHAKDYFMSLDKALSIIDLFVNYPANHKKAMEAGKEMLSRYMPKKEELK